MNMPDIIDRVKKAQEIPFDLHQACPNSFKSFVAGISSILGCHEAYVLFPLLSSCAGCLGSSTVIELTSNWCEPATLWTLTISRAPSSIIHKQIVELFQRQLIDIQNEFQIESDTNDSLNPRLTRINFVLEYFTQAGLLELLIKNGGFAIGAYISIDTLKFIMKEPIFFSIFLKLFNGGALAFNEQREQSYLPRTSLNLLAHAELNLFQKLYFAKDEFGKFLQDTFVCVCPYDDCTLGFLRADSQVTQDLRELFKALFMQHFNNCVTYKLSSEAKRLFENFCQNENSDAGESEEWTTRGLHEHYYNRPRLLARLTCILHVINECLNRDDACNLVLFAEISMETLQYAITLVEYITESKKALLFENMTITKLKKKTVVNTKLLTSSLPLHIPASLSVSVINVKPNGCEKTTEYVADNLSANKSPTIGVLGEDRELSKKNEIFVFEDQEYLLEDDRHEIDWEAEFADKDFFKLYKTRIARLLTYKVSQLTPSKVSQVKMFKDPSIDGNDNNAKGRRKYTCGFAKFVFNKVASYGFGEVDQYNPLNNRAIVFKKKRYEELSPNAKNMLELMDIPVEDYNLSFSNME